MNSVPAIKHDAESIGPPCNILTVPEVALALRCSKAHVHHLIRGSVPGVRPCPPYGWAAAASSFARASRNGSGPMNRPPDQCYDPITPVFIAKTHGKDKRASTATSERQFAGKTTREAQNVGFALSRRRHQEVRNAGAAFQDEQEPGRGEAGRAFKRSERPQRGNA